MLYTGQGETILGYSVKLHVIHNGFTNYLMRLKEYFSEVKHLTSLYSNHTKPGLLPTQLQENLRNINKFGESINHANHSLLIDNKFDIFSPFRTIQENIDRRLDNLEKKRAQQRGTQENAHLPNELFKLEPVRQARLALENNEDLTIREKIQAYKESFDIPVEEWGDFLPPSTIEKEGVGKFIKLGLNEGQYASKTWDKDFFKIRETRASIYIKNSFRVKYWFGWWLDDIENKIECSIPYSLGEFNWVEVKKVEYKDWDLFMGVPLIGVRPDYYTYDILDDSPREPSSITPKEWNEYFGVELKRKPLYTPVEMGDESINGFLDRVCEDIKLQSRWNHRKNTLPSSLIAIKDYIE